MDNKILNKVITVAGLEIKDNRFKLTDQDGKTYSFFKDKQDGSDTKAYTTFNELNIALNSITEIGYKENGKYKNILSFKRPSAVDMAHAQPFVTKKEVVKNEDERWDKINGKKNNDIKKNMCLRLAVECWYHSKIEKTQIVDVANWLYVQEVGQPEQDQYPPVSEYEAQENGTSQYEL